MTAYTVPIVDKMPSFAELEKEFGEGNVSSIFDDRLFKYHPSCKDIEHRETEEMILKQFDRNISSEDAIAEMEKEGYRPATHLELYAFAKANPELQRQFWIIALGSSALRGDYPFVAMLCGDFSRRILDDCWFDRGWVAGERFLFVKKKRNIALKLIEKMSMS